MQEEDFPKRVEKAFDLRAEMMPWETMRYGDAIKEKADNYARWLIIIVAGLEHADEEHEQVTQ